MSKLTCTHPMKIFYIGKTPKGRKKTYITGIATDYVIYDGSRYQACNDLTTLSSVDRLKYRVFTEHDIIPCGNCIACRLKQSMEFANRGVLENDYHETAYFLTITYDKEYIPTQSYINDYGEVCEIATLRRDDLVKFNKRLRRNNSKPLTIIQAGEYGAKTFRPHYHEIVWDLEIPDLKLYKSFDSASGIPCKYYTSDYINNLWGNKGYIIIAEVNFNTIAYVCRYNLKKTKNDMSGIYDTTGIEPEFRQLPQKPALGRKYFEEHFKEIYKNDEIIHPGFKYKTARPPKYFDSLLEQTDKKLFAEVKNKRRERFQNDEYENLNTAELIQLDSHADDLDKNLQSMISKLKGGI